MADIYLGIAAMIGLGLGCFWATRRLVRETPRGLLDLFGAVTVVLLIVYIRWMWDSVRLAQLLPHSNLIVIGNWFLPLIGVLAGLVWGRIQPHVLRRTLATGVLFGVGLYATISPLSGATPNCESRWVGNRCMQTTRSTCSPAAAATLLAFHGIAADEQEMADLCLTREGTTWKGMYRGLKIKTAESDWDVDVFASSGSLDELTFPAVICTRFDESQSAVLDNVRLRGWIPDTAHSVVVVQPLRDGYLIADPARGLEAWTADELIALWDGVGIRLVPRNGKADLPAPSMASVRPAR